MTLRKLTEEIDRIEKEIFLNSLYPKNVNELELLLNEVLQLKEIFLKISFIGTSAVEELEDIRIRLNETLLNIRISIKEKLGESAIEEMQLLNELYQTIQSK